MVRLHRPVRAFAAAALVAFPILFHTGPTIGTTAQAAGSDFTESFDSPASLDRFDFGVHDGREGPKEAIPSWPGDHNANCGGPTTERTINLPNDRITGDGRTFVRGLPREAVYWCSPGQPDGSNGHMMTAYNTKGYAQIQFRPDQIFTDVKRVCWDQNKTALSRQWTQMLVVPEDTYLSHTFQDQGPRLDYVSPRVEENPGRLGVKMSDSPGAFLFEPIGDSRVTHTTSASGVVKSVYNWRGGWTAGADRATRYTNCVSDNEDGTVTISLERTGETRTYTQAGAIPDGRAVVIFQDDNYNSSKDGATSFTWHWDNIIVE